MTTRRKLTIVAAVLVAAWVILGQFGAWIAEEDQ